MFGGPATPEKLVRRPGCARLQIPNIYLRSATGPWRQPLERVTDVPTKGAELWVREFRTSMSVPPGDISVAKNLSEALGGETEHPTNYN